jgi:hypothetical protein
MKYYEEVLSVQQRQVLSQLGPLLTERQFYLAGGTALALHLGHRRSVDLGWFTPAQLAEPLRLAQELRDAGIPLVTDAVERGTLHGTVSGVRVTFLEYRYGLLAPLVPWPEYACQVAAVDDLACMKLAATAQRGSKKDFVDIYALGLRHCALPEMLRLYQQKYAVRDIGHVLYALVYFDDANRERMPEMLWDKDWQSIKKTIQEWVKELAAL